MFFNKNNSINSFLKGITVALGVTVMLFFIALPSSCTRKKDKLDDSVTSRDSLPLMNTGGMTSLVSDSGYIRYRIIADEWLIFDKMTPSFWSFEKGVYVERFDTLMQVDAHIEADTAYYFDKDRLWELRSNVKIVNLEGVTFTTDLLYWNQITEKIYSDAFVTIVDDDNTLHGYGFDSDQTLQNYVIRKPRGVGYIEMNNQEKHTDSIQ